ncbi:hypothetical protein QBC43DRAFT_70118 [Cladorrhinum sp. PSN259]|nr:hypothetical protein QBC43DRAFT_70118 [Cladorrhinum sp. PSN259]
MHALTFLTTLASLAATGVLADNAQDCQNALTAVALAAPVPTNTEFLDYLASAYPTENLVDLQSLLLKPSPVRSDLDKLCTAVYGPVATMTVPADLTADYSSYKSEFSAYSSSWAPTIKSVAPKCTDVTVKVGLELAIVQDTEGCKGAMQRAVSGSSGASADSKAPGKVVVMVAAVVGAVAVAFV